MEPTPTSATSAAKTASLMSRFKKEKHLLSLSEDNFRDYVVRPVLHRMGLEDGRDMCGPDEEGKDTIFFKSEPLRKRVMYAVQTKSGKLNMTRKATENITEAITQLRTALQTPVSLVRPPEKRKPDCVVLCASGKINKQAREHISSELNDTRVIFLDADELIPEIDKLYPEYWYGIDADKFPYYRSLREELVGTSEIVSLTEIGLSDKGFSPITEEAYVPLHLYRMALERKREGREVREETKVEEFPVQAVLRKPENLVIVVGDPGSGKSTSLRRIAYMVASKALLDDVPAEIPVLLRCNELAQHSGRLVDLAAEVTSRVAKKAGACFNAEDLTKGNVVILLDALDEVASTDSRGVVLRQAKEFVHSYPKCKVIVTSRRQDFLTDNEELGPFAAYNLCPFSIEQAERLVKQMTALITGRAAPDATEIIRRIKDVHGVDLSPLLVTILVATSDYNRHDIPANITELFKKYTEMMLGRWDRQKGLSQQIHAPIKDFLLRSLAFSMHQRKKVALPLSECRELFKSELESRGHEADMDALFDEIVSRSGLVRVSGGELEFRHLLIQEFFAGRAIPSQEFLKSVIIERWWSKAVVFYFGENPASIDSIQSVIRTFSAENPLTTHTAAGTLGLAVQACYLSKVDDKRQAMAWVVRTFAAVMGNFLSEFSRKLTSDKPSLLGFITYYLAGRDSVSSRHILEVMREVSAKTPDSEYSQELLDAMMFWCLVGLAEIGELKTVEAEVRKFKPADTRLLLGIHLGCYFVANLRITSSSEKDIARRISSRLANKIRPLMFQLMDELKSMLLEERKGTVQALPHTPPAELLESAGEDKRDKDEEK